MLGLTPPSLGPVPTPLTWIVVTPGVIALLPSPTNPSVDAGRKPEGRKKAIGEVEHLTTTPRRWTIPNGSRANATGCPGASYQPGGTVPQSNPSWRPASVNIRPAFSFAGVIAPSATLGF